MEEREGSVTTEGTLGRSSGEAEHEVRGYGGGGMLGSECQGGVHSMGSRIRPGDYTSLPDEMRPWLGIRVGAGPGTGGFQTRPYGVESGRTRGSAPTVWRAAGQAGSA